MAQKGTSVLRTPYPLYAINCIDDKHFVVAGGGGKAKTGITNSIVCILYASSNESAHYLVFGCQPNRVQTYCQIYAYLVRLNNLPN